MDIIVVTGTGDSLAAKQATASIPIITIVHRIRSAGAGRKASTRPGGNVTGLTTMDLDDLMANGSNCSGGGPRLAESGILVSPDKPMYSDWLVVGLQRCTRMDGPSGSRSKSWKPTRRNFDEALSNLVAAGTQGLVVSSDGIFLAHRQQLIEARSSTRLPATIRISRLRRRLAA